MTDERVRLCNSKSEGKFKQNYQHLTVTLIEDRRQLSEVDETFIDKEWIAKKKKKTEKEIEQRKVYSTF